VSTLHTIARSPRSDLLTSCLQLMGAKDGVLLMEDGVFYCLNAEQLAQLPEGCKLYALREDIAARGLQAKKPPQLDAISTRTFVDLCCSYDKVVNWF
jgi:tRNA 2-thiouridine synthesizing protein B